MRGWGFGFALMLGLAPLAALAHGKNAKPGHHAQEQAEAPAAAPVPALPPTALPFDVGGPFTLTDQFGATRTQADPEAVPQLLFFGYANCPGICGTAMPMMADAVDLLAADGLKVHPVMVTVDPARDRVETMAEPLALLHPDFIGLTGSEAALQVAYDAYAVEKKVEFVDPEYGDVFSHSSFIYLLDGQGEVLTLFPPILTADRVTQIVSGYIAPNG